MNDSMMRERSPFRSGTAFGAGLAIAVAIAVGGCSTNMTGFNFPTFGLVKKETRYDPNALQPDPRGTGARLSIR